MRFFIQTGLLFLLCFAGGCATIINGSTQQVSVSSDPPGAQVMADGNPIGVTPLVIDLQRKSNHIVTVSMDGYHTEQVSVVKVMSGAVAGNILAGGFIGWGIDAASGAQYKLKPDTVTVQMRRLGPGESNRDPASAFTLEDQIRQLDRLRRDGILTDEEFRVAKASVLSESMGSGATSKPDAEPQAPSQPKPTATQALQPVGDPVKITPHPSWLIAPVERP